jgi:hypothetical protein
MHLCVLSKGNIFHDPDQLCCILLVRQWTSRRSISLIWTLLASAPSSNWFEMTFIVWVQNLGYKSSGWPMFMQLCTGGGCSSHDPHGDTWSDQVGGTPDKPWRRLHHLRSSAWTLVLKTPLVAKQRWPAVIIYAWFITQRKPQHSKHVPSRYSHLHYPGKMECAVYVRNFFITCLPFPFSWTQCQDDEQTGVSCSLRR